MIEVTTLDDVGLTLDNVRARNIPARSGSASTRTIRRTRSCFANPSGWLRELGRRAREATTQSDHDVGDIFGHRTEAHGFGMDIDLETKK